jgi:outer membrane lipoprotein SlyB
MKSTGLLLAAVAAFALGGCAVDGSSNTSASTQPSPYVVDSYPSNNNGYNDNNNSNNSNSRNRNNNNNNNRCYDCGTVQSVNERQIEGKPNVTGALIGAILGGVVGNQFGGGNGKTAATAGGAIAGGAIGSQVYKEGSSTAYDMNIRMDSGEYRMVTVAATGNLRAGSRVRISGDHVTPM